VSDQFATRFGYGLQLITGLEKFEDKYSEYDASKDIYILLRNMMILTAITSVTGFCMMLSTQISAKIFGFLFGTFWAWATKVFLDTQRPSAKDMTYDNIRDRYMRIRNQIVELIKNPDLSVDVKTALLSEISAIDIIIEDKKVFRSSIERLVSSVIPSDRKAVVSIQQQREIEDMIANDIFVSAQRLSLRS
jgi:hypothetical protein